MHQTRIQKGPFNSSALTVAIGTTVTGTNNDFAPHTVTEVTKIDSGILAPVHKFKQTFDYPGIVKGPLYLSVHVRTSYNNSTHRMD